jgi:hypothetical protein
MFVKKTTKVSAQNFGSKYQLTPKLSHCFLIHSIPGVAHSLQLRFFLLQVSCT